MVCLSNMNVLPSSGPPNRSVRPSCDALTTNFRRFFGDGQSLQDVATSLAQGAARP